MALSVGDVQATLSLRDQMTPGFKTAADAAKQFASDVGGAGHDAADGMSFLGGVMNDVFNGFPAKVAEGVLLRDMVHDLIAEVKAGAVEFGLTGSAVDTATSALDRLAGSVNNADAILSNMRDGVKGTIDDMNLMEQANKLMATGALSNAGDFGTLTTAARTLSLEGFGPIPDLLSKISNAMETGRTTRLALSGITVDAAGAEAAYAASLGITAPELTKSQKLHADRAAIIDAATKVVQTAGSQELTLGERITASGVAIKNWTDELAGSIAKSPDVIAAFDAIQNAFLKAFGGDTQTLADTFLAWVNKAAQIVQQYGPQVIDWLKSIAQGVMSAWNAVEAAWDRVPQWFKNVAEDALLASIAAVAAKDGINALAGSLNTVSSASSNNISTMANVAQIWSVLKGYVTPLLVDLQIFGVLISTMGWDGFVVGVQTAGAALLGFAANPVVLAIAAIAALGVGYVYWKTQLETAVPLTNQAGVDAANLARINTETGQSFKNLGDAVAYLTNLNKVHGQGYAELSVAMKAVATDGGAALHDNLQRLTQDVIQMSNQGTLSTANMKEIGAAIKSSGASAADLSPALAAIVQALANMASAADDAAGKVSKHEAAVRALLQTLLDGSKASGVFMDAFSRLTDAELQNFEVQERLIPQMDKLSNSHVTLTLKMHDTYVAALDSRDAMNLKDVQTLYSDGLSLEYIDTLKRLGESEQNIATRYGVSAQALKEYTTQLTEMMANIKSSEADGAAGLAAVVKGMSGMPLVLQQMAQGMGTVRLGATQISGEGATISSVYQDVQVAVDKALTQAAQSHLPLNAAQLLMIQNMKDAGIQAQQMANIMGISLKQVTDAIGAPVDQFANLKKNAAEVAQAFSQLASNSSGEFKVIATDISQVAKALDTVAKGMDTFQKGITSGNYVQAATGIISGAAGVMSAASGGGVKGTVGGAAAGAEMGAAIGSIVPGIGTAIGAAIGGIGGALVGIAESFGASEAEKAGRTTEASFEQQFGGFQQMMTAVGAAYATTGLGATQAQADVQALMNAEKLGTAATQDAIDKINAVIAAAAAKNASVALDVQSILDTAKVVGLNFPDAMKPMITSLESLPGLTDAEKSSLNGLLTAGDPTFTDLSQAAGRYGLTLDTIGGKAGQLSISTEADQIISDYQTLVTKSGADSDKVLAGMTSSLNTLVQHAMDTGDVLPTALQPLINQLFNTGQLTDAFGNKITDVSNLKFDNTGDPLSEGMQSLTDAINNLSTLLDPKNPDGLPAQATSAAAAIGNALGNIKVPDITIPYTYVPTNTMDGNIVPMAAGGDFMVTKPTLFLAGEAGPERATFSGGGKTGSGQGGGNGGDNTGALLSAVQALPFAIRNAVRDGMLRTPVARR